MGLETRPLPTLVQYPTSTPIPENSVNTDTDTDTDEVTATESSENLPPDSDPAVLLYAESELAFLYSCPALDCNILAQLETGQAILVVAVDESWYESLSETYVGYILAEYLSQFPSDNVNVIVSDTVTAIPSQYPESSSTPTNTPPPTQMNETTNSAVSVTVTSSQNPGSTNNGSSSQNPGNINNGSFSQNPGSINNGSFSQNPGSTNNGSSDQNTGNNNNSTLSPASPIPTNTNRPVSPTATWTPSATPTSTATLSFDDLPDVPDTVLTPIIVGDPGLPVVITVTTDADIALPTISAFPTDSPPGQ